MKFETKVKYLAMDDAHQYKMGELLVNDIAWKTERINGYGEAFAKAYNEANLTAEAKLLGKARERLEKKGFTGLPVNKRGRKIKVAILVAGGIYVANRLGYLEPVKVKYRRSQLWLAGMQDPESETYKNFLDDTVNKVAAFLDPEGDPSKYQRYKNKRTVVGETVQSQDTEGVKGEQGFDSNVSFEKDDDNQS